MVEAYCSVKNRFTRPARESGSRSPAGLPFLRSKANYPRSSSIHISRPVTFALQACRSLRLINFRRAVAGQPDGGGEQTALHRAEWPRCGWLQQRHGTVCRLDEMTAGRPRPDAVRATFLATIKVVARGAQSHPHSVPFIAMPGLSVSHWRSSSISCSAASQGRMCRQTMSF